MSDGNDVIRGAIVLNGQLEGLCFCSWEEFVRAFPQMFAVEVPSSITNVQVSMGAPGADQLDNVWIKLDPAGSFVGIFVYAGGAWRQLFPAPNAIIRMYGNSSAVPDGFILADTNNPHLSNATATALMGQWILAPAGTYYEVFDVTYEGF